MTISLRQVLELVGTLDDTPGKDSARERFRVFLQEHVTEAGQVRDYVEECLRLKGTQFNRALQDLVNHVGRLLGFEVTFGRYQGVPGEIGFDGHWKSDRGFHIVIETKTTDAYSIKASTLTGYVDALISDKKIPDWDHAMGLYVVGRPDIGFEQLENTIIAERRINQLRIVSVESLLSLTELTSNYEIDHEDVLELLRPSSPTIDHTINMMSTLVAQVKSEKEEPVEEKKPLPGKEERQYWLTPVKGNEEESPEEVIEKLVSKEEIYAFGDRTPGRRDIGSGDLICFYATGNGVIADAEVKTPPEKKHDERIKDSEKYPWVVELKNPHLYKNIPVIIDADLRQQLEAFEGKDANKYWAWFVQATRKLSGKDFQILTRQILTRNSDAN
ncbi:MAG: EVE domain-containing protein [Candidatus Thermoplasmatota archaeon]|nr:EVE domain-containing protein [Candidatus Thermoplasmatota archaeon]MDD5778044.1 EVE domain-containing protein [Candidatus Thermoplasmatota archaeon]